MANFNLQDYLEAMDARTMARFDSIEEQLQAIPELKTRVALVESSQAAVSKGLWGMFVAFIGAGFAWLFSFIKN